LLVSKARTAAPPRAHSAKYLEFIHKHLCPKGALISESFSIWLKSQKLVPYHYPEHRLLRWIVLRRVICPFFWLI
jgi:hypothetical protein